MNLSKSKILDKSKLRANIILKNKNISITLLAVVILTIFSAVDRNFISVSNILALLRNTPELGIVTIGMTMLLICGEFDLSVGSIFGLAPFFMVYTITELGFPQILGFIISILVGALCGLLNGVIVTKIKVPSLIATLGMLRVYRGFLLLLTKGKPFMFPKELKINEFFNKSLNGFSVNFLWFMFIAAIMYIILENHRFGNWTFVTGGNRNAANALGIPVNIVKILNFVIIGILSAFAGCIQTSRLHSITAVAGTGIELTVIAATVIGGTLLAGGSGTIVGAVMGIILIFSVENILIIAGAPTFWFQLFVGIIIIVAVAFHLLIKGRRES
jgi:simple sugar transport system permease protein